jgi:hypothetical protein
MCKYKLSLEETIIKYNIKDLSCRLDINEKVIAWIESQLEENQTMTVNQIRSSVKYYYGIELTDHEIYVIRRNFIYYYSSAIQKIEYVPKHNIMKLSNSVNFN